jgi:hypothetical protein
VSRPGVAVRNAHIAALLGVSLCARAASAPTAADLARCAEIAATDARLACYDALAGRTVGPAVSRAAPPPALPSPSPPTPPSAPAAVSAAAPAAAPENFGFSQTQVHAAPVGPQSIQARIAKLTEDRLGHAYVLLDNGQTWTFTEYDGRLSAGDPVTIKRAALGSFLMLTPSKHSYSVRRRQ